MDEDKEESNLRHLPPPVAKAKEGETADGGVIAPNAEVQPPAKPADVIELFSKRLKAEVPSAEIFARRLPELLALSPSRVVRLNLSVEPVVVTVLGAVVWLRPLREQFEATFRAFDFKQFDSLEEYVFTLNYTEMLVLGAERPPRSPPGLQQEVIRLQRELLADCRALEARGLLDGSRLRHLEKGKGFGIWANNLSILACVLNDSWPAIVGRCGTSRANLSRAEVLVKELLVLAGQRDQRSADLARVKDLRARAFTLLINAYEEARLAALYVLKKQDLVDIKAPPLGRDGKHGRKSGRPKRPPKAGARKDAHSQDSTKP